LSSVSFYTGIFFSETKGQKMTKSDGNSLPGEPKKKATNIFLPYPSPHIFHKTIKTLFRPILVPSFYLTDALLCHSP
jgi:hypothetical protein